MKYLRLKKKLHFQLLEIMIAVFLMSICIVPLLKSYVFMHLEQKEIKRSADRNQLVHEIHSKALEKLYNEPPNFIELENGLLAYDFDGEITNKLKALHYEGKYQLKLQQKRKRSETYHLLIELIISLKDLKEKNVGEEAKSKEFIYYVYARRSTSHASPDENKKAEEEEDDSLVDQLDNGGDLPKTDREPGESEDRNDDQD